MKIRLTYESRLLWPGAEPLGTNVAGPKERRLKFDYTLLRHTINTITGIMCEIKLARTPISFQWISTISVEKKFSKTRMHVGVHQTVVELIKTIEDDDAMQFIYVQDQVKNRRLPYGKTIARCTCLTGIRILPLIYVEAVIHIVEFPATISPLLGEAAMDEFHIFAEKLMFDTLLPFAKTNFNMTSPGKGRSLYQELQTVAPSSRRIIFSQSQRIF
jgi:hypothetical protein